MDADRCTRSRLMLGVVCLALAACGGGSSGGGDAGGGAGGGGANVQAFTVHWQQPPGPDPDGYVLSYGPRSRHYEDSVDFPISAVRELSDGTLEYEIELDRAHDQYLRMRGYNGAGYSPPSNELRVPGLGSAASSAASAVAAVPTPAAGAPASTTPETTGASLAAAASQAESGEPDALAAADANRTDEPLRSVDLDGEEHLESSADAHWPDHAGFTLSLWEKASAVTTARRGLFSLTCSAAPCAFAIALDDAPEPAFELLRRDASGQVTVVRRLAAASALTGWWHLALSVDPELELASLYVDGERFWTEPATALPPEIREGAPFRVAFGATPFEGIAGWSGRLGHAAWFARALDAAEIEALALGGHELDLRAPPYVGALAPIHYWRLGADSSAVGRDFAAGTLPLDDPRGGVDAADIALDAPLARTAEEGASGQ